MTHGLDGTTDMPTRSTVVRIAVGVFLLVTAGLKLYGLGASDASRTGWFAQPWVQLLTAEWELVLGAWLLSGDSPRWSCLIALLTFCAFAVISGYLAWIGIATCPCFGAVRTVNPWWVLGLDILLVVLLASGRPWDVVRDGGEPPTWGWLAILFVCLALSLTAYLAFGSLDLALARIRGEQVVVVPRYVDIGSVRAHDQMQPSIAISNLTDAPVRILGGSADCVCVAIHDLPVIIPPQGNVHIRLDISAPNSQAGAFAKTVRLWTDNPAQPEILIWITGQINE